MIACAPRQRGAGLGTGLWEPPLKGLAVLRRSRAGPCTQRGSWTFLLSDALPSCRLCLLAPVYPAREEIAPVMGESGGSYRAVQHRDGLWEERAGGRFCPPPPPQAFSLNGPCGDLMGVGRSRGLGIFGVGRLEQKQFSNWYRRFSLFEQPV